MGKIKLAVLSMGTLLLLAACGEDTDSTVPPTEPDTEETTGNEEPSSPETDGTTETDDQAGSDTGTENTPPTETPAPQTGRGIENTEFDISLDDAVQIFFDTFPEAEGIDNVDFDVDDGRFEYEIDGFNANTEFELTINAETGEILEQKSENDDDRDTAIDFDNIISPQEAMTNALEAAGSGYVKEWNLDTDDGRTIYDIDIEGADNGVDDVEVNAETGEIIEIDS